MIPPAICYSWPLAKDFSTQPLDVLTRNYVVNSDAAGTLDKDMFTVPLDKVFIMTAVNFHGQTGGGQAFFSVIGDYNPAGAADVLASLGPRVNTLSGISAWTGEVWVPGGKALKMLGYAGAAAVLSFVWSIHGILIPRGSVSYA